MYKKDRNRQYCITDFDQPMGMKLNPENRWVKKSETIPWDDIEDRYAELFPNNTGMPAKPLRMALGSLLIQKKLGFSDRELVAEIVENPYLQYFIGLPAYQNKAPFAPSLLVEFRKRLTEEILGEINEMIIDFNTEKDDSDDSNDNSNNEEESGRDEADDTESNVKNNEGTLIIDATCAPQNISYPQDINLLNEARENLEKMIDQICYEYGLEKPRTYRKNARRDYLSLAKCKKRTKKRIRNAIKQQLQYVRRDLKYVKEYLADGKELSETQHERLHVIEKVYEQQKYMYDNHTHTVKDRIVSISQPYIRPIVRGKAKAPVEFGAKLDMSLDENGMARLEKISFDAYNECGNLQRAVERYYERTGHYPERVLVDKIYRNRDNLTYCKERGIRLSGPALGRPKKDSKADRKTERKDNKDRIEVERGFSLAKRNYGLGLIKTKLDTTTRSSIVLSIIAMNVEKLSRDFLHLFSECLFWKIKQCILSLSDKSSKLLVEPAAC